MILTYSRKTGTESLESVTLDVRRTLVLEEHWLDGERRSVDAHGSSFPPLTARQIGADLEAEGYVRVSTRVP